MYVYIYIYIYVEREREMIYVGVCDRHEPLPGRHGGPGLRVRVHPACAGHTLLIICIIV